MEQSPTEHALHTGRAIENEKEYILSLSEETFRRYMSDYGYEGIKLTDIEKCYHMPFECYSGIIDAKVEFYNLEREDILNRIERL